MEVKLNATADHVFGLLTDPKWLEARSLALGELSAKCSARKSGGVQVTMKRRVHRDMNAIIAKVLNRRDRKFNRMSPSIARFWSYRSCLAR